MIDLLLIGNMICYNTNFTYMRFHRMHEITSTAMEETKPITTEIMTTTSLATTVLRGLSSQIPHTGRQTEAFPTTLQEKPS